MCTKYKKYIIILHPDSARESKLQPSKQTQSYKTYKLRQRASDWISCFVCVSVHASAPYGNTGRTHCSKRLFDVFKFNYN